ncbi:MAG: MATE family efflux transporter [Deltaproteobacteria bacterium]|nr:MATE family efflux transporter [Deltaproteobacteria bacterium]
MARPDNPNNPDRREPDRSSDGQAAAHEVEAEIEELGDPETGPTLPATTLAARGTIPDHATARPTSRRQPASGLTREIVHLGWPVMLSQGLVSIAGLVDRAMIGRLGGEAGSAVPLAAVGYATQFFFLIQSALFAVGLACVALMARAIGAGEPERSRQALSASMQIALGVTLVFSALMLAAPAQLMGLLGAEPEVVEAGLPYLQLVVGSSVLLAITLTFDSALRADRNTRTPMLIALVITAVKLVGNYLLIFGELGLPRLGLVGAGIATAISHAIGVVIYVVLFARRRGDGATGFRWRSILSRSPLTAQVIRVAAPGILERVILNLSLLSYFWVLSRYYGTLAVAAYTVGVPLLSFSWIPGSGYAQSCATLVGQRLGAGDRAGARATGVRASQLALATAIPLGVLFGLFRFPLARIFTDDAAVIEALGPFMLALAVGQPFLQLHFTLGGAHRGAGDTMTPLVAASVGNWLLRVPLACLFAIVLEADVVWVWYALVIDHASRAALLLWSFHRGRWMSRLD